MMSMAGLGIYTYELQEWTVSKALKIFILELMCPITSLSTTVIILMRFSKDDR